MKYSTGLFKSLRAITVKSFEQWLEHRRPSLHVIYNDYKNSNDDDCVLLANKVADTGQKN